MRNEMIIRLKIKKDKKKSSEYQDDSETIQMAAHANISQKQ